MPYDPVSGLRKRGRPSHAERIARPDIFNQLPDKTDYLKLIRLPVDPITGKRRSGRPTREEQEERMRLIAEAKAKRSPGNAVVGDAGSIVASRANPFEQMAFTSITGLKEREYESILLAQKGHCATCLKVPAGTPAGFCNGMMADVDQRGVVRGLLCPACYSALNLLNQDPGLLRRVTAYMARGDAVRTHSRYDVPEEITD